MASYICRIDDLGEFFKKMLAKSKSVRATFEPEDIEQIVGKLKLREYGRIKWFFYCDDLYGNTIRLYDGPFFGEFQHLYVEPKTYVILRGKNLGGEREQLKRDILDLFGERDKPPREISTNAPEACLSYFEKLNNGEIVDPGTKPMDSGTPNNLYHLVQYFRQVIIYGPPGTGKTRLARQTALHLLKGQGPPEQDSGTEVQGKHPSTEQNADIEEQLAAFRRENRYDLVVFHPSYEYEQFLGGIEPTIAGGNIGFQVKAGPFLRLCRSAEQHREDPVIVLIDEINRGNLPKLLGELVYALEYRGSAVTLPFTYEDRCDLVIPHNLYMIGTMNSADRSIGHIDVAIRRRFGLYHLPPSSEVVKSTWKSAGDADYGEQLAKLMENINSDLEREGDSDAELGVGQSYFIPTPASSSEENRRQVEMKWENQVCPLLREYAQLLNLGPDFLGRFPETLGDALAKM